jgi:hypothetical protein
MEQTWTLTTSSKRKLVAAEMLSLRSVAGVTPLDLKRSEDIRKDPKIFKLADGRDVNTKQ